MKKTMQRILAGCMAALMMIATMTACGETKNANELTVGICNYVDDASLNQIVENIQLRLQEIGKERNVTIKVRYDNCNGDPNLLAQIISNFTADKVDLMIGVATPVAMAMQAASEESGIPVVFAAVSDPVGAGLATSLETPDTYITGTSDFLDTTAVMNLIFAAKPETKKVGLLYDQGQDSSTAAVAAAKDYLAQKNVICVERTGTTVDEIVLAAQALIAEGVEAIFTPSDNTVMKAELSIYEMLAEAGIPHYAGADSFALNGAFVGYGVDYINLGRETANMAAEILLDGKKPSELPIRTFDNGTATINTEICAKLGYQYEELEKCFAPYCMKIQSIVTAEHFEDLQK